MKTFRSLLGLAAGLVLATAVIRADSVTASVQPETLADGGGELLLKLVMAYDSPPQAMGLVVSLPDGWTFAGLDGMDRPQIAPPVGTTGAAEFAWMSSPDGGTEAVIKLAYPPNSSAAKLVGQMEIRRNGEKVSRTIEVPLED